MKTQAQATVKLPAEQTKPAPLDAAVAATPDRRQSVVQTSAAFLGIAPAKIYAVLRGIWTTSKDQAPLSDGEIWRGLAIVARYELDPFAREIYVSRDTKGNPMIIIGIDGWIRILNRTDHYDGMDVMIFHEDDDPDKPITRVETTIYSKKRSHPARYMAYASDYAKVGGFMKDKIPGHMLRLFSMRHAARLFIPLGGVVTEEEARWMGASPDEPDPVNSLDELTAKLTGEQIGKDGTGEPVHVALDPPLNPPAAGEVKADQSQRADEYAQLLADALTAGAVGSLVTDIDRDQHAGLLTDQQGGQLFELGEAAKTRLSHTE